MPELDTLATKLQAANKKDMKLVGNLIDIELNHMTYAEEASRMLHEMKCKRNE